MLFSIIIPLYNKAPYIRKALESVLAQTYTDYELIVVDDGSTDGSAEIAEAILEEAIRQENGEADNTVPHLFISSSPYRLLRQQNAGVSAARNNGVAQAQGEYLAFLDADDWWEPTYLERMAQLISDYPDAGLYACNYVYYKPGKTHVALNISTGYINYPKAYYESDAMPVWTGAAMIPRHVYDEMGGFPLGIKLGEDFLLWAKIALHYPVAFLNEPLAWYNNDVPATLRATRNLHKPEHHMLFRMDAYLQLLPKGKRVETSDWKLLIDKLRVGGLLEYWMSKKYHNLAAIELAKVDWSQQPNSVRRIYTTPIWLLKYKRLVMQVGSCMKQKLLELKYAKDDNK